MSSWTDPLTEEEIAQRKQNVRRRRQDNDYSQQAYGRWDKHPEKKKRHGRLSLWHKFVLLVGYAALIYGVFKGVLYILIWLEAAT